MYDLIVIGAGWAGYNACMAAKKYGLKTALIERDRIGGTCLNTGCIPTKTLIQSSKTLLSVRKSAEFGISVPDIREINFKKIQERKTKIILQLRAGMEAMLKGVDLFNCEALIGENGDIYAGGTKLSSKWILSATGSRPAVLEGMEFDGDKIISSDQILELDYIPSTLLIVGGGVIGCEFACIFASLGSKVTMAEFTPSLLPGADPDVTARLASTFKKRSITVLTSCDAKKLDRTEFEKILVCVGRKPVNCIIPEPAKSKVYSAGDCTGSIMLAHFAAYQGRKAVEKMKAGIPPSDESACATAVPSCVFTDPEIASVGLTQEEASKRGIDTEIRRFDFLGSGMARILGETDGFVKIAADAKTSRIIGGSIIGPRATEMISALTVAIQSGMTLKALSETIFPHPTLSEAISEALNK